MSKRLWLATLPVMALGAITDGGAETIKVVPSVSITETYSDNVALLPDEVAQRGWITDLIPGVRIDANSARLKGFLDYRLHRLQYSNLPGFDSTQHILSSSATLEAVEKFLFVDGRADISQQNRSPTQGAVAVDRPSASSNRLETRILQLSPHARGQISDLAVYQLRYSASRVTSDGNQLPPTRVGEFVGRIRNASPSAKIGWAFDMFSLTASSGDVGTIHDNRARGLLIYAFDPLFTVAGIYGRESTDLSDSSLSRSSNSYGVAVNWQPSPRTQFAGDAEKRFFGTGHTAVFSHKTARTAWRFTSSRDAAVLPGIVGSGRTNSISALLAELLAPVIVDPTERAQAARRRLDESGIPEAFPIATGFVTARPLIFENQTATLAFIGTRNTMTAKFTRVNQRGIEGLAPLDATPNQDDLRQMGLTGSWAHRLTPVTTLTASATALRTDVLGLNSVTTRQNLFSLSLSTALGPRTNASLGVRHTRFSSPVPFAGYRENAVVGALQFRL